MRLPKINIANVLTLKEKIFNDACVTELAAAGLTGDGFDDFVEAVRRVLPKGVPYHAVYDSLIHLAGSTPDDELLDEMAWRLAGNVRRLRNGYSVTPWGNQLQDEWMPLQVVEVEYYVTARGKPGAVLYFQILAGTGCPLVVNRFWPRGFCQLAASRLGFGKPWQSTPFKDVLQFVNMRMYGLMQAEYSQEKPGFEHVDVTTSMQKWNRDYLKMRYRTNPKWFSCPRGYSDEKMCHVCPVGQDECPAAVHNATFVRRHCETCDRPSWFDPKHPRRPMCVDCYNTTIWKGLKNA